MLVERLAREHRCATHVDLPPARRRPATRPMLLLDRCAVARGWRAGTRRPRPTVAPALPPAGDITPMCARSTRWRLPVKRLGTTRSGSARGGRVMPIGACRFGYHVAYWETELACRTARKIVVQPLRHVGGQRRDPQLVEASGPEHVADGVHRVGSPTSPVTSIPRPISSVTKVSRRPWASRRAVASVYTNPCAGAVAGPRRGNTAGLPPRRWRPRRAIRLVFSWPIFGAVLRRFSSMFFRFS